MFFGLPDSDPLVRGSDPAPVPDSAPDPFIIKQKYLSLKNDVNVASKSNKQKNLRIRFGSVRWRYESPDPDPYKNVTDPHQCIIPSDSL
jgi:hypothetical protein